MKGYDASTYGESIADVYDELYQQLDPSDAVAAIRSLANGKPVLELGVGTGRIAVPLAEAGVDVSGIDISEPMLARLRAKTNRVKLHQSDFAEIAIDGAFGVVFVAFNTFFTLPDQDAQLRCFTSVATKLLSGGVFVIEAFVPDTARFTKDQVLQTLRVETDHVVLEATKHDRASQRLDSQLVMLRETGVRFLPIQLRYAWPSELDVMAKLAGLRIRERWANWRAAPFSSTSTMHVSIYERT
jgi:SAM-dependent methyltransferase